MNLPTVASLLTITTLLTAIASTEPERGGTPGTPPFATVTDLDTTRPDSPADPARNDRDDVAGNQVSGEIAASEVPEAPEVQGDSSPANEEMVVIRVPAIRDAASRSGATRNRTQTTPPEGTSAPPSGGSPVGLPSAAAASPNSEK